MRHKPVHGSAKITIRFAPEAAKFILQLTAAEQNDRHHQCHQSWTRPLYGREDKRKPVAENRKVERESQRDKFRAEQQKKPDSADYPPVDSGRQTNRRLDRPRPRADLRVLS